MVCIIDDREDVWNMASNLIQVKPYHFFQHTGDINAPPELSKHELDGKGVDFSEIKKPTKIKEKIKSKYQSDEESFESDEKIETEENVDKDEKLEKEQCPEKESGHDESGEIKDKIEDISVESKKDDDEKETSIETLIDTEKDIDDKNTAILSSSDDEVAKTPDIETKDPFDDEKLLNTPDDDLIVIEDPDDYLLYLEEILKRIHNKFYKVYNKKNEIPDLKMLIPKLRSKILVGTHLVFSGLVPNHMKLEQSKAFQIAKSLGANVQQNINDDTTHLVAVTAGTIKYNTARKKSNIRIVTPDWLWSCAERWECVDERVFPVDPKKPSKMRQPPAHCHSPGKYLQNSLYTYFIACLENHIKIKFISRTCNKLQ